jgi:hypothetical protein
MSKVILILAVPVALVSFLLLGELNYESGKQRAFPKSYAVTKQLEEVQEKMKVERARLQRAEEAEGTPKAVVETTEHNFGVMEPDTEGSCEFVIRNEGTAPLTLVDGGKTCFCVGFNVSDPIVEPGASVIAELAWNTKFPAEEYRHGASLRTNDPETPLLKFRVNGSVLTTLGFDHDILMFSKIWPGQPQTQEMMLFSEVLDEFEIVEGVISNPRFEWSARKLTSDELPLRTQSAYAISITAPGDLPRGRFEEELTLTVKRPDRESRDETEKLSLNIQGYTAKRLTIFGKELSSEGTLNFSVVPPAQGRTAKLFLRVNDEMKDLSLEHVEVNPEFLEVDLQPENPAKGLYTLNISIPPYSPQGTYTADTSGDIHLQFNHPRIEDLHLKFNAVILPVGQPGQ